MVNFFLAIEGWLWLGDGAGKLSVLTGWERTVHVSRCPALYSECIFVPLCRKLIIFVF